MVEKWKVWIFSTLHHTPPPTYTHIHTHYFWKLGIIMQSGRAGYSWGLLFSAAFEVWSLNIWEQDMSPNPILATAAPETVTVHAPFMNSVVLGSKPSQHAQLWVILNPASISCPENMKENMETSCPVNEGQATSKEPDRLFPKRPPRMTMEGKEWPLKLLCCQLLKEQVVLFWPIHLFSVPQTLTLEPGWLTITSL